MHIIGEILGASDFSHSNLFCKYEFLAGHEGREVPNGWTQLDGTFSGQTQESLAEGFQNELVVWNHPIDVYYSTTTLSGWPKIVIQVWHEDMYGRHELCKFLI